MTRLVQTANVGDSVVHVLHDQSEITSWKAGDWISFDSTSFDYTEGEKHQIKEVKSNGEIELETPMKFLHFGSSDPATYIAAKDIDMRGEVSHLTKTFKIEGDISDKQNPTDLDWGFLLNV